MLRPAEMRELRIVTLEGHVDGVIKKIEALGSVHLIDIKEFIEEWEGLIEPSRADAVLIKTSELLTRIDNIIALLRPPTEGKKSLKEMLFKERVEEKGEKIKVEEIRLEEIETDFSGLEDTVIELTGETERLRGELSNTKELSEVLKILEEFSIDLDFVGEKEFISVHAGKLPSRNLEELGSNLEAVSGENHFVLSKKITGGEEEVAFAVIVTLKKDKEEVERALMRVDFEPWQRPPADIPERIKEAIEEVETRIKRLGGEIKENEREIAEIRRARFKDLLVMQELAQIEENKAKVKILFGTSERVRVIEGWTPKEEVENVIEGINEETGGFSVVEVREPKREDVRVPSLLNNPRIIKPFESVVKMYGHPLYNDIDPTLITAIIFPILFGLMFPDMGHGLLLLLLGLALTRFTGLGKGIKEMGVIIVLCGLCSVIAGALFGEFFGFSEYASHLVAGSVGMHLPHRLVFEPLWFEPIPNLEFMFVLTMLIGAAHMGLGLVFNVVNNFSNKKIFEGISGVAKIWCLFGSLYFLLVLFRSTLVELKEWIATFIVSSISFIGLNVGIMIFILLPIISLFVLKIASELKHEEGGEHSSHSNGEKRSMMDYILILMDGVIDALLENFFRFLANTVSYGRILALALAHAVLIEVFILLSFMCLNINPTIGPVIAAVVFLAGTVIVVILEAIMAGIQAIRLHFYEWFTKFYEGGGVEFSPFKFRRTYTY